MVTEIFVGIGIFIVFAAAIFLAVCFGNWVSKL